ncbi:hypothetical protein [Pseudalkalibacillus sp. SCS-8]|uniref:hypothetical protein n=1 Tax=Pseudalkalibacillus nanhaiensis TaxID=3115291 RepID=UPI0032DA5731
MDLETVWTSFDRHLTREERIETISKAMMAGIPFVYLTFTETIHKKEAERILEKAAVQSMKGKRLQSEMIYVRQEGRTFVYRCRFYVPNEKMFCCGNLCHDCIRFKN